MYQLNKTLLQIVRSRDQHTKLKSSIHLDRFDKEVRVILKQINKYWNTSSESEMNMEVFVSKFFLDNSCSDSERALYNKVFQIMQEDPDPEVARDIIRDLRLMEFNRDVENAQNDFVLGEDIDLYETIREYINDYASDVRRDADTGYCKATVEEMIEDELHGSSLDWQLDCL